MEVVERHPQAKNRRFVYPEHSFAKFILRKVKRYLAEEQESPLNSSTLKPKDFFLTNKRNDRFTAM